MCASFTKNMAHCFLSSCCSASPFLQDSHNRMHSIVLIKRLASLAQRNYKCKWETSCCQACTMLFALENIWRVTSDNFFPKTSWCWKGLLCLEDAVTGPGMNFPLLSIIVVALYFKALSGFSIQVSVTVIQTERMTPFYSK